MKNSHPRFRDLDCDVFRADCPARTTLTLLAEKWSVLVIHALSERPYRTSELRRRIGGVSEKMLIQTLRRLETHGLVSRQDHHEVPPRVDYSLTPLGASLGPVIRSLDAWIEAHAITIADWPSTDAGSEPA